MKLVLALLAATHTAAAFGPAGYRASHDPVSRCVPRSAVDECTIVFDADGAFCMEDSHMNRATALDCLATDECDVPEFQEGALRHQSTPVARSHATRPSLRAKRGRSSVALFR